MVYEILLILGFFNGLVCPLYEYMNIAISIYTNIWIIVYSDLKYIRIYEYSYIDIFIYTNTAMEQTGTLETVNEKLLMKNS